MAFSKVNLPLEGLYRYQETVNLLSFGETKYE